MKNNKICAFDLSFGTTEYLKQNGLSLYDASLGKIVRMNYGYLNKLRVSLQADIPKNLHEYNTIIIDLTNEVETEYRAENHTRKVNKSNDDIHLVCYEPQNIFDPRPYTLGILQDDFNRHLQHGGLIITFCGKREAIKYHLSNGKNTEVQTYSFLYNIPIQENKHGEIIKVAKGESEIYRFLEKYLGKTKYHVTFKFPQIMGNEGYINDPNFFPLMYSHTDEIVSYFSLTDKSGVFLFPDVEDKATFLVEFLNEIAPTILPQLFPERVKNKWLEAPLYRLPNEEQLLTKKNLLIEEYKKQLVLIEHDIEVNAANFQFLKDLLVETDKALVTAVVKFLKWLGFDTAVDADDLKDGSNLFEEDIQIETERGLIIAEVKGIGGTSTDANCSQIGKVRFRRAKERNKFDVFPHYIVNHQRHIPAEKRTNPPFSEHQISDAENDQRGLLTTWQLFNLYSLIENGVFSKEDVRNSFYEIGYIDFIPKSKKLIGVPKEFYQNNTVVILEMQEEPRVKLNDTLLVVYKDQFQLAKIKSIKYNDDDVLESTTGEVGLKLSIPIKKGSFLYI